MTKRAPGECVFVHGEWGIQKLLQSNGLATFHHHLPFPMDE